MISLMQLFAMYKLYRQHCNNNAVHNTKQVDPTSSASEQGGDSNRMALCGRCDAPLCDMGRLTLEHPCQADYDNTGDRTSNMKHAGMKHRMTQTVQCMVVTPVFWFSNLMYLYCNHRHPGQIRIWTITRKITQHKVFPCRARE